MPAEDAQSGANARLRRAPGRLRLGLWLLLVLNFCAGSAWPETLTLADCLRETVEHNPLIIQKRLALEEAGGSRLVFRSRALPTLTVGGLAGQQGAQTTGKLRVTTKVGTKSVTVIQDTLRPSTLFLIGSEALNQPLFDAAIPASLRRGNIEVAVARSNFLVTAVGQLYAARVPILWRVLPAGERRRPAWHPGHNRRQCEGRRPTRPGRAARAAAGAGR